MEQSVDQGQQCQSNMEQSVDQGQQCQSSMEQSVDQGQQCQSSMDTDTTIDIAMDVTVPLVPYGSPEELTQSPSPIGNSFPAVLCSIPREYLSMRRNETGHSDQPAVSIGLQPGTSATSESKIADRPHSASESKRFGFCSSSLDSSSSSTSVCFSSAVKCDAPTVPSLSEDSSSSKSSSAFTTPSNDPTLVAAAETKFRSIVQWREAQPAEAKSHIPAAMVVKGSSTPENCPICIAGMNNPSFADSCFHRFCYVCLLEWSKIKAECPLCKAAFTVIFHDIKSVEAFEEYKIPVVLDFNYFNLHRPSVFPEQHVLISQIRALQQRLATAQTNLHESSRPGRSRQRRLQYARDVNEQTRMRLRLDWYQDFAHRISSNRLTREQIRQSYEFRRLVYDAGLRCQPTGPSTDGTVRRRCASPTFYQDNPATTHRLVPFLRRELYVLQHDRDVNAVIDEILRMIRRMPISGAEFRARMAAFISERHTATFAHELHAFATSVHDTLELYDSALVYDYSSFELLSGNDDVIVLDTVEHVVREQQAAALGVRDHGRYFSSMVAAQQRAIDHHRQHRSYITARIDAQQRELEELDHMVQQQNELRLRLEQSYRRSTYHSPPELQRSNSDPSDDSSVYGRAERGGVMFEALRGMVQAGSSSTSAQSTTEDQRRDRSSSPEIINEVLGSREPTPENYQQYAPSPTPFSGYDTPQNGRSERSTPQSAFEMAENSDVNVHISYEQPNGALMRMGPSAVLEMESPDTPEPESTSPSDDDILEVEVVERAGSSWRPAGSSSKTPEVSSPESPDVSSPESVRSPALNRTLAWVSVGSPEVRSPASPDVSSPESVRSPALNRTLAWVSVGSPEVRSSDVRSSESSVVRSPVSARVSPVSPNVRSPVSIRSSGSPEIGNPRHSSDNQVAVGPDSDDVEVLAELLPKHMRTPEIIQLDDEVEEEGPTGLGTSAGTGSSRPEPENDDDIIVEYEHITAPPPHAPLTSYWPYGNEPFSFFPLDLSHYFLRGDVHTPPSPPQRFSHRFDFGERSSPSYTVSPPPPTRTRRQTRQAAREEAADATTSRTRGCVDPCTSGTQRARKPVKSKKQQTRRSRDSTSHSRTDSDSPDAESDRLWRLLRRRGAEEEQAGSSRHTKRVRYSSPVELDSSSSSSSDSDSSLHGHSDSSGLHGHFSSRAGCGRACRTSSVDSTDDDVVLAQLVE